MQHASIHPSKNKGLMDLTSIKMTLGTILGWFAFVVTSNNVVAAFTCMGIASTIVYNMWKLHTGILDRKKKKSKN